MTTVFRRECRKVLVGLAVFAALFVPMILGGIIGYAVGAEGGMLVGMLLWPIGGFIVFMAWAMGDSFDA